MFECINIDEIIKKAATPESFIKECEQEYESKLCETADAIAKSAGDRPFVLVSGPSGSGKTTSALKLEARLDAMGFITHTVSLDDYFLPITDEERPLFEAHKIDLESPARIDSDLLCSQLRDLMAGKTVELPGFDFVTSSRKKSGRTLTLKKGEMIILEGIHSLNPSVIENAESFSTGVYVSARTRISHAEGGEELLLHPSKLRLARRMMRDKGTRNRAPSATVALFENVERGENLYIMPHKHRADHDINTFFAYELCVYKPFLPASLPDDEAKHPWLTELFNVLSRLPALPYSLVPCNSLLREFLPLN